MVLAQPRSFLLNSCKMVDKLGQWYSIIYLLVEKLNFLNAGKLFSNSKTAKEIAFVTGHQDLVQSEAVSFPAWDRDLKLFTYRKEQDCTRTYCLQTLYPGECVTISRDFWQILF